MYTAARNWLVELSVLRAAHLRLFFPNLATFCSCLLLSGLPAVAASVVTALEGLHVCAPVELPCITLLHAVM